MEDVLDDIITAPLALKKVRTPFSFPSHVEYAAITRVESYYMRSVRKFTWLAPQGYEMYVYGNPYSGYTFN